MIAQEVIGFLEGISPPDSGIRQDDNKLLFGDPSVEVKAIGVAWMATTPVIKEAISKGINLLIVHEALFFSFQDSDWYKDIAEEDKEINKARKRLLEENGVVVYRAHSNWDALSEYGVMDSLGSVLGYERVVGQTKFFKTYEVPTSTLKEVAEEVKRNLGLDFVIVYGDLNKKVSRVTPLVGGFGGNQKNMPEIAKSHGSQVIIVGDLVEYTTIHAQELGLSVIKTLHSASETPGVKNMFRLLKEKHPQVPTFFLDSGCLFFKGLEPKVV